MEAPTRRAALHSWRMGAWQDLWIYLTSHGGGPLLCRDVAAAIGAEPRALVNLARMQPLRFAVEYRTSGHKTDRERPAVYVRIADGAITPAPPPAHARVVAITTAGTPAGQAALPAPQRQAVGG